MPLSGTNKKCARCKGECKQFEQVTVVVCPMFEAIDSIKGSKEPTS